MFSPPCIALRASSQAACASLQFFRILVPATRRRVFTATKDSGQHWIPGLVDLQINGWAGVDFNNPALSPESVEAAAEALLEVGVVSFLPTVITGSPADMESILKTLADSISTGKLASRMIPGIHLEGPFISPADGPRGAHPLAYTRVPDIPLIELLYRASGGNIRMLTLAPELPGAEDLIRWCHDKNILVSIGHSGADGAAISRAVRAGATFSTHLGNGCATSLHRHDNVLWHQLAEDGLFASMIADGHHLPLDVMKTFLRAKGDRLVLVSDATWLGGSLPGTYDTPIGGRVLLSDSGRLSVEGSPGTLAGAALPLIRGVTNLVSSGLCDFDAAWRMASERPASILGMSRPAGEVLWDFDEMRIVSARLT